MKEREADDRAGRQFLLGALAEEERARIEAEALRDGGRFEELLCLEDDLFHDYAQGGLSDVERRQFEARFLSSPEGVQRLESARLFLRRLGPARAARSLPLRYARWLAAAAALLVAAGSAWLGWRSSPARVREAARPSATPSAGPSVTTPSAPPVRVFALALSPGLVRGTARTPQATLPAAGEATLRLTLLVPAARREERYSAALQSADGLTVWSGAAAAAMTDGQRVVVLDVPAASVPEGDYEVVLRALTAHGAEEVAAYPLRVLREAGC